MEIKITIEKPEFGFIAEKTTTNNENWRKCVHIEFPNCISTATNKPFKWVPTYKQLVLIYQYLQQCEVLNKQLAKKYYYGEDTL